MSNVKKDIQDHVEDKEILCASVNYASHAKACSIILKKDYSEKDYNLFLSELDFKYDDDGQELHGSIWYADGSWSERRMYEDYEEWEHYQCPAIPLELMS